jgi:AcrR family transcriptional regulator
MARVRAERREVAESRERILATAERFFAVEGLDAPLHRLAEEAGVGNATLFRRFPGRDDLVRALYDRAVTRIDALAERVELERAPGWDRLVANAHGSVALVFDLPVLPAVMNRMAQIDPEYRPGDRWIEPLVRDVEQAQRDGVVRPDATGYDFAAIPLAVGGIAHLADPVRRLIGARLVTLMLDGLRAPGITPLPDLASLTVEAYHRGVHGLDAEERAAES